MKTIQGKKKKKLIHQRDHTEEVTHVEKKNDIDRTKDVIFCGENTSRTNEAI